MTWPPFLSAHRDRTHQPNKPPPYTSSIFSRAQQGAELFGRRDVFSGGHLYWNTIDGDAFHLISKMVGQSCCVAHFN